MVELENNFAKEYVPTRTERFWRWLGFRYHLYELPETDMPGWMMTKTAIQFDWADRLRLLLTGRINIDIRQATDVKVSTCASAVSFEIVPPWR